MLHLLQVLLSVRENCVHVGLVFLCLKRRGAEGRSKGVLREQQTNVNVPTALASKDWIISLLLLLLSLSNIDIKYLFASTLCNLPEHEFPLSQVGTSSRASFHLCKRMFILRSKLQNQNRWVRGFSDYMFSARMAQNASLICNVN